MGPWPIEEALFRPVMTLLLAALLPVASARLLFVFLVGRELPPEGPDLGRALAPFRRAAFVVGLAQVWLAWTAGATALGPALVSSPNTWSGELFGAGAAALAFLSGGVGRLVEARDPRWAAVGSAITLRLRLLPFFVGPIVATRVATALPFYAADGEGWTVRPEMLLAALVIIVVGLAYGGLASMVLTFALRPATPAVAAMARGVAAREGVSLWAVLRLPTTPGSRFANAAALPWARTMIVTDRIVEMLEPDELRAVMAHEAGHLSEPAWVIALRIGAPATLFYLMAVVAPVLAPIAPQVAAGVAFGSLAAFVLGLFGWVRLARRMERRADARARETVGAAPLAAALTKIHDAARAGGSSGWGRVHPPLAERLEACGAKSEPVPAAGPERVGLAVGVLVSAMLVGAAAGLWRLTQIADDSVTSATEDGARWRLRVDPWDENAMLAMAWAVRQGGHMERAEAWLDAAEEHGAPEPESLELRAELAASEGRCEEARSLFDMSLEAGARRRFERDPFGPLTLGDYHLPPTLVSECGGGDEPLYEE